MSDLATPVRATSPSAIEAVDARLAEMLSRKAAHATRMAPAASRLWAAIERLASGGKRVRPRLLLDAHLALAGEHTRQAVDAACAMELLHLALVVHDDVIDGDLVRHGDLNVAGALHAEARRAGAADDDARATGDAAALLAGDLLLTLAQSMLARLDVAHDRRTAVLDAFDEAVLVSAIGEHEDVWLGMGLRPATTEEVLAMLERKTAAYSFQAPLEIAALLAGSEEDLIDDLRAIGRGIGLVYQLRDDVLGVFGDERATGKSVLSDLRSGKQTLLVAHARSHSAWREVADLLGDPRLTPHGARRLRDAMERSGARVAVERRIRDVRDDVHRRIDAARVPEPLRQRLHVLAADSDERRA